MLDLISAYLKENELAWAPKTLILKRQILSYHKEVITGDPKVLWERISQTQTGLTRVTTWQTICGFWDFAKKGEANPYREFRKKNARLFKDQYVRKTTSETMKGAREKIESITDPSIKRKALELLLTGMRWSESLTYKDGMIVGKGNLPRKVDLPKIDGPELTCHYRTFIRALEDVGLKPHALRKIYLTECVNSGANVFELQQMAGWKSLQSALSYINVDQARLQTLQDVVRKKSQ